MVTHKGMRTLGGLLLCAAALAQSPPAAPPDVPTKSDIVVPVNVVIAPTTVLDRQGNYVNGLTIDDFKLFDNGRPQRITTDVIFHPISMVVAVEATSMLGDILPKVQRIGVELSSLVVGENGEAAVVAFDHRVRTVQDFTDDPGKIESALKSINTGSSTSAMIDAATESIRMLQHRPSNRRRILLLVSEKRDKGSQNRLRETLEAAEFANVTVYAIDISHIMAQLTGKAQPPRPDPIPTTAQHAAAGGQMTPTEVQQNSGSANGNVIPVFTEIFKGVKGLFVDDTLDVFTRYTGGKQYSFVTQKSLDKAVTALGEEIHSQYLLSYSPSPDARLEGGYHQIRVEVNRPRLEVRTRPGYWMAAQQ